MDDSDPESSRGFDLPSQPLEVNLNSSTDSDIEVSEVKERDCRASTVDISIKPRIIDPGERCTPTLGIPSSASRTDRFPQTAKRKGGRMSSATTKTSSIMICRVCPRQALVSIRSRAIWTRTDHVFRRTFGISPEGHHHD